MSETRVNMRKIVGLTDDLARLAPQGDRPRIGMGIGVAYAAGYHAGNDGGLGSLGGKGELGERDADAGRDDGPVPRDAGDGMHDAAEALPPAGEIPGLEGLYDCNTGRCVNVRFDGVVPPPEGWEDACTPPQTVATHYVYVQEKRKIPGMPTNSWPFSGRTEWVVFDLADAASVARAKSAIKGFDARLADWVAQHPEAFENSTGTDVAEGPPGNNFYNYDWCFYLQFGPLNAPEVVRAVWPAARCSEVAYHAESARFEDGSCGNDPNMPQHLQGRYGGFELCDKDGNKVRVRRTRYGIEVEQEKHGRVTTLDPDTFKVVNQLIKQAP